MKKAIFIIFAILTVFGCSAENLLQNSDMYNPGTGSAVIPPVLGDPEIIFTHVPSYNSYNNVAGKVLNIIPIQYKLCMYILVGSGWWVKPYALLLPYTPWTTIQADSSWVCDYTTGGIDQQASIISMYLMPIDYPIGSYSRASLEADKVAFHMCYRLDTTLPTLSITNPATSYMVISNVNSFTNYNIGGAASDESYINGSYLYLNGSFVKFFKNANVWGSKTVIWQTNLILTLGSNIIQAYSKDYNENLSITQTVVIFCQKDLESPTVQFTTPDGVTTADTTLAVTGTASDNMELEGVYMFVNGRFFGKASGTTNWTFQAELTSAVNTVSAYSKDTAGNVSETLSITVNRSGGGTSGDGSGGIGGVTR